MSVLNLPEELKDLIVPVDDGGSKKFSCQKCNRKYVNLFSVKQHVVEKHSVLNVVTCLFSGCDESFPNLNKMRTHCVLVHGEGPQPCPSSGCPSKPAGISRLVITNV